MYDNLFPSLGNASATKPATSGSAAITATCSRTPSKVGASRRSGRDVQDCYAQQSETNETERGVRVVEHS